MYKYFQLLQLVADQDPTNYSIKELTDKLAYTAGYYRDEYIFKNGNKRVRTFYSKPFDNVLTAKWILFYKNLFISKLRTHPEMSEYYSFIINRTFYIFISSYQPEIAKTSNMINKRVNMCLINRIGEVLYILGSQTRFDEYDNKIKNKLKVKNRLMLHTAINHGNISLDQMAEDVSYSVPYNELNLDDLLVELRLKLQNNEIGIKLLNAMLYSNKKIIPQSIDKFIDIPKEQCTEETKTEIVNAWKIIEDTLKDSLDNNEALKYKWGKIKKVKYSFER